MDALLDSRQAGALEITPAMIEAGCNLLIEWDSDFYDGSDVSPSAIVSRIFSTMALIATTPA